MALNNTVRELGELPSKACEGHGKRDTSLNARTSFLSIPVELRTRIYEELLREDFNYWGIVEREDGIGISSFFEDPLAILRVCKKIYVEVKPMVYKTITLNGCSGSLIPHISPHNLALIEKVIFDYDCHGHLNTMLGWNCRECHAGRTPEVRNYWTRHHDYWGSYFDELVDAGLSPKNITIYMNPCDLYRNVNYSHTDCNAYRDLTFLKFIGSRFANVRKITLYGLFDPLWGFALRKRLGFDVKRRHQTIWHLVNPEFYYSTAGYKQSSTTGVYDNLLEE
ncbi:hypothetical protein F5Y06DRAFT_304829 [Hypoxylon sp. FL0890]|nr:hypothetical protein F5Y06DRAFT_304829 [Hypoxylon sp. FL0890]